MPQGQTSRPAPPLIHILYALTRQCGAHRGIGSYSIGSDFYIQAQATSAVLQVSWAWSISYLVASTNALAVHSNNDIVTSTPLASGNQRNVSIILGDEKLSTTSNISSGTITNDDWALIKRYTGTRLCAISAYVVAAHALSSIAVQAHEEPMPHEQFTLQGYEDITIKVTPYSDRFTRYDAAVLMYQSMWSMRNEKRYESSRFTMRKGDEDYGRAEFSGYYPTSGDCGPSHAAEHNQKTVITSGNLTFIGADDDDTRLELDCKWEGKRIQSDHELLSILDALANDFASKDSSSPAPIEKRILLQRWGITFIIRLEYNPDPRAPTWTYYWTMKALGALPRAMAEQEYYNWMERTAGVKVDGFLIGKIYLWKGLFPDGKSSDALSLTGNSDSSITSS